MDLSKLEVAVSVPGAIVALDKDGNVIACSEPTGNVRTDRTLPPQTCALVYRPVADTPGVALVRADPPQTPLRAALRAAGYEVESRRFGPRIGGNP